MRNIDQSDVQATLRDMWETRPSRRADDRKVAGVAAAIARRYDLDPTLVRIGFVVAAFSGIGAALYIAGWFALPSEPSQGGRPRSRQGLAIVGLVVAAAVTLGWWGDGGGVAPVLVGLGAIGLLFLLHRSRSEQLGGGWTGATGVAAAEAPTTATGTGPSLVKEGVPMTDASVPTPPSWDPLGAAPFAWDLPEPGPPPAPEPAPRRLPVTPVTLGVALLAAAVTSFVLLLTGGFTVTNAPVLLGVLLAVVGAGLVIGSFVRAGRGLIPIALLLSALTWGALAVPAGDWDNEDFGDLVVAPTSVAAIQPVYERAAGSIELDLTDVDLALPQGGTGTPVRTRISAGVGDVTVKVPEDADVTVAAKTGIGDVEVFDQSRSGPSSSLRVTDLGEDGVASGRPLVLDIEMGAGSVEVQRD
ncbi:PspC domain-containing protein [Pseudonocardia humida]|uniref:PspC domain-containing protein n=1 Tax=Pseudonocardia humida TaxID=2800819 RepID=A0ABT0ZW61_9PSEU|nr:PspC domain-containing protein [Pseudonocardia humida]MCO1654899.1 PspC domain-containing protein [Pseudonocardia humida]